MKKIDARGRSINWIEARMGIRAGYLDTCIKEREAVMRILSDVREQGDAAVLEYTLRFDQAAFPDAKAMKVTETEIQTAYDQLPQESIAVIEKAAARIRDFHERQKRQSWVTYDSEGCIMGQRVIPLERVGIYVPGGRAAYPSSVLMNAIPARVAGVGKIVMVTPPDRDGRINPATLVAARIAGIDEIYKVGGAQAIGALAYGTETIPRVDKITGPGNIYVTLAKKEVYGIVDIDMIAGPSEVLVVADGSANPVWVAADLLSQAEHDPMARSILVTDSEQLAERVMAETAAQAETLSTRETIERSLADNGYVVLVDDMDMAIEAANAVAPEHLELAVSDPHALIGRVRHAGSVFMGHYATEPLGDYMAGPNHVLPTGGTARFFSALNVDDFVVKSSTLFVTEAGFEDLAADVAAFAHMEGLTAHARAVEIRMEERI
jgi:histidinol dehydrogenase